jgi:hypothetical protein
MADISALQTELDAIEAKLSDGIRQSSVGDRSVTFDLEALERRAASLRRQISAASSGSKFRRVVFRNA